LAIVGLLLLAASIPAVADEPNASVTFTGGSVAAGVGFSWGGGNLHFQGKDYPFTMSGLSVADVGIAKLDGSGDVYGLLQVQDFAGTYVAAAAGVTVAGGGVVAVLENQKGVKINVRSTTEGLKFTLAANGVSISLK
jgi:hypothetical protein